jgi:hypothetical protein
MKDIIFLVLYYPFLNHVIEFSSKWSLKLYAITKYQYFSFQTNLYF